MSWHENAAFIDALVKEYLVFRKMTATVKAFEAELKSDKDKGFRVDKIVQQLMQYIHTYDIESLTSYWSYLKEQFLTRFAKHHVDVIAKFEADLCRLYMVHAVQNGKTKELQACLQKLTELNNVPGLKDWYVLMFSVPPDLKSMFSPYFSKQWSETFVISLYTILSAVFSCMPVPSLIRVYMDDGKCIETLEKENKVLREAMASGSKPVSPIASHSGASYINHMGRPGSGTNAKPAPKGTVKKTTLLNFNKGSKSQNASKEQLPKSESSQTESGKGSSSPKLSSIFKSDQDKKTGKTQSNTMARAKIRSHTGSMDEDLLLSSSRDVHPPVSSTPVGRLSDGYKFTESAEKVRDASLYSKDISAVSENTSTECVLSSSVPTGGVMPSERLSLPSDVLESSTGKEPYLILSKDIFHEHHSAVLQCKFDNTGKTIASVDNGGIVKVWQNDPAIKSLATVVLHSKIQCLEWSSKSTDYLVLGTSSGTIRFFDITSNVTVKEAAVDDAYCSIHGILACPTGTSLVTTSTKEGEIKQGRVMGRIMRWDIRPSDITFSRKLHTSNSYFTTCMDYNHNGNLMVVGDSSGVVTLFDMKTLAVIRTCVAHTGAVSSVQFSSDEALVLSIGADNEMMAWDVNYAQTSAVKMKFPDLNSNLPLLRDPGNMPLLALSPDGCHGLVSGGCRGLIYDLDRSSKTATKVLALPEHKECVTALDWISSKSCGRCLTGSGDGKIHVTTLLSQT